jgi:hypothetical protein
MATLVAAPAWAGQYLVSPGDSWDHLAAKVQPGDEIILMPGDHKPAALPGLTGRPGRPIIIRGLSHEKPSTIEAVRDGLKLFGARYVVIKDVKIVGARINGIMLTPPEEYTSGEPVEASVTLSNVSIENTGPEGNRHAVRIEGVTDVDIELCTFRGWAGSAIFIDAASRINVRECLFQGKPEYTQRSGIAIRGGATYVRISDCTFVESGAFAVEIGGVGRTKFTPPSAELEKRADVKPPLAADVYVSRCTVRGSACPVHFYGAMRSTVRNSTFHRPRQWALAVDVESPDPTEVPSSKITYGSNLIVWEPGDLQRLVRVGSAYKAPILTLEENLWWSPQDATELGRWPETPAFPQIVDVDPALDDMLRPTTIQAELFGSVSP